MKATILPNGDLEFALEPGHDDPQDVRKDAFGYNWPCLLEWAHLLGNGYDSVAPEWIGALTEAPIVTDGLILHDDGSHTLQPAARIWWYPDYMVSDPAGILADTGRVVFTLAR